VHAHGAILVIDGAQAHGGIAVDVKALGVDA
jgi:selenocysteine lyase/cysteine desulfurase